MADKMMKEGMKLSIVVIVAVASVIASFAGGYILGSANNSDTSAKFTIVDDLGRVVSLNGFPQRIISVAPTPTEVVFAVGAEDLLVGIDTYSDYPNATANVTKIGDSSNLNVEKIISLEPDLIISSDLIPQAQLDFLATHGIPYLILTAKNISGVYKDIRLIGQITNHSSDANALVSSLQIRVKAITDKTLASNVTHPKTLLEYYPIWTYGQGSFGDDLIRLAGGTNIAGNMSGEYVSVDPSFVISKNPDVIIYTVGSMTITTKSDITGRPGWQTISAVVNDKIFEVNDDLITLYGPRIVDGLEDLAALLHPELFP